MEKKSDKREFSSLDGLDKIAKNSLYCDGPSYASILYSFEIAKRHIKGKSILEMGPAEGVMTDFLIKEYGNITVVEGSRKFCENLKNRYPVGINVHHSLFEMFEPNQKFDAIILGHVIEHVDNPDELIAKVRRWLSKDGILFAAVPNAQSIHRQAAVVMGVLPTETSLNKLDIHHGHKQIFTPIQFRNVFLNAGMKIDTYGGYWLKPVSNGQIKESWTPEMLQAFMVLGERYPDIAGEIYVVASNK